MKVIIDDKIPYIDKAARRLFDKVVYMPGSEITKSDEITDADALIIRTRTKCDRKSLEKTSVRFIATATIGLDHINTADMASLDIQWTNCPGCNASSVGQYVRNSLIVAGRLAGRKAGDHCVGIVGYGHVGREVFKALAPTGCTILVNDPPLQEAGFSGIPLVGLDVLAGQCDVITFHTPLTREGRHKTLHLADRHFFDSLQRKPIIINAARGGVVDEDALLRAHSAGKTGQMIIDTWENEPQTNPILLNEATIATPHIAGYSADGKSNATRMALRATCRHFGIPTGPEELFLQETAPPPLPAGTKPTGDTAEDCLTLYNPLYDTERLKLSPDTFEQQRGNYPLRRESF